MALLKGTLLRGSISPRVPLILTLSLRFGAFQDSSVLTLRGLPRGSVVVPSRGLPYRILDIDHKKELLWSLGVWLRVEGFEFRDIRLRSGLRDSGCYKGLGSTQIS